MKYQRYRNVGAVAMSAQSQRRRCRNVTFFIKSYIKKAWGWDDVKDDIGLRTWAAHNITFWGKVIKNSLRKTTFFYGYRNVNAVAM